MLYKTYTYLGEYMKKLLIIVLLLFSFFYTNKSISIIRNQDPLMKEIIKNKNKFEIKSVNAIIKDNTIIPGIKGKEVDLEKTYTKMKQYGTYNEALTVFKEIKPTISIEDNYDKLITSGNKENKNIALIFKVEKNTNLDKLLSILNYYNVQTTFFIDGLYIENNDLNNLSHHQIELLSYNNTIDEVTFSSALSYLSYKTNKTPKYCLEDNNNIIKICKKLNLHTVSPTLIIKKDPYKEIKNNLKNSSIILIPINNYIYNNLSTSILYIKSKGYKFLTLTDLLSENLEK